MARRSALPDIAATVAMPGKPQAPPRTGDYGWTHLRRQWSQFPEMAECLRRDAEIARGLAITHESHPAYPELLRAYQDNGQRLGKLRDQHRQMLREKAA